MNGAPRSPGPGAAGGVARDLAQLRPRDGWWCAVAGAAGLGVYAWRVPPTAQAWDAAWGSAVQGSNALGGIPWICAAVGYAGFAALSLMLILVDVRTLRLPNRLLAYAAVWLTLWLLPTIVSAPDRMAEALVAAAVLTVIFSLVWWRWRRFLGGGDVKLAPLCGFAAGWIEPHALVMLGAALCVATLPLLFLAIRASRQYLPFGPSLVAATWMVIALPSSLFFT